MSRLVEVLVACELDNPDAEALWPQEFPLSKLKEIKKQIGDFAWSSLYQGSPVPRGKTLFGDPARFKLSEFKIEGKKGVIAVDPAATAKTRADHSAIVTLYKKGDEYWVVDSQKHQVEVPDLIDILIGVQTKGPWSQGLPVTIESVGAFKAVAQMVKRLAPNLPIKEVFPKGDKYTRAQDLVTAWNAGKINIPTDTPWAQELIDDVQSFTGVNDRYDDTVDAFVYGFKYLSEPVGYFKITGGAYL